MKEPQEEGRPYCLECGEEIKGPWESHQVLKAVLGELTAEDYENNIIAIIASAYKDRHIRCTEEGNIIKAFQELQEQFTEGSMDYRNPPGPMANRL